MREAAQRVSKERVESALQNFQAAIVYQIESGSFQFPITSLIDAAGDETAAEAPSTTTKFEQLEILVEHRQRGSDGSRQSVMFRLKTLDLDELTHARWPASLSLSPSAKKSALLDPSKCFNFQLCYQRELPASRSNVWFALQGLRVSARAKSGAADQLQSMLPSMGDVQAMVSGMADRFVDREQELKKKLSAARQASKYLNIGWLFELNDCELVFFDTARADAEARIRLKFSHFEQDLESQFESLQSALVQSKIGAAQSQADQDELHTSLSRLQQQYQQLEMQLVETKLALVEAQAAADSRR
jgi:hypothetical protein